MCSPFFFDEQDWIPAPRDWAANIVRGKGYDLREGIGAEVAVEATHLVEDLPVNFPNQVVPLFTKYGCNGGGCLFDHLI